MDRRRVLAASGLMPHCRAGTQASGSHRGTRKHHGSRQTTAALLLNLPLGALYLVRALAERNIEARLFAPSGALVVLTIFASIPLLFALGRKITITTT